MAQKKLISVSDLLIVKVNFSSRGPPACGLPVCYILANGYQISHSDQSTGQRRWAKIAQVDIGGCRWMLDQVDAGGTRWTQVDVGGGRCTQVDGGGPWWKQVDPCGCRSTHVYAGGRSRFRWTKVDVGGRRWLKESG